MSLLTMFAACLREATWVDDTAEAAEGGEGEGEEKGDVPGEGPQRRRRTPPLTMWQLSFSGLSEQVRGMPEVWRMCLPPVNCHVDRMYMFQLVTTTHSGWSSSTCNHL